MTFPAPEPVVVKTCLWWDGVLAGLCVFAGRTHYFHAAGWVSGYIVYALYPVTPDEVQAICDDYSGRVGAKLVLPEARIVGWWHAGAGVAPERPAGMDLEPGDMDIYIGRATPYTPTAPPVTL